MGRPVPILLASALSCAWLQGATARRVDVTPDDDVTNLSVGPQKKHDGNADGNVIGQQTGRRDKDRESDMHGPLLHGSTKEGGNATKPRNRVGVLSWNVAGVTEGTSKRKKFVTGQLREFADSIRPAIMVLQEIESCRSLSSSGLVGTQNAPYGCVESTIPDKLEEKTHIVLGNVILYDQELLLADNKNRIRKTSWSELEEFEDRDGKALWKVHRDDCTWGGRRNGHGCSFHADVPGPSSVLLKLKQGHWEKRIAEALETGLRVVDVHLFAGGHEQVVAGDDAYPKITGRNRREAHERARADRRAFQFRGLLALTRLWNKYDLGSGVPEPSTVFAGDFNTRGRKEMRLVARSMGDLKATKLWCIGDGRCDDAESKTKTSRAGYLDHVALEPRSKSGSPLIKTKIRVLQQNARDRSEKSDHNPLLAEIWADRVKSKSEPGKVNPKKPVKWDDENPFSDMWKMPDQNDSPKDRVPDMFSGDDFPALG